MTFVYIFWFYLFTCFRGLDYGLFSPRWTLLNNLFSSPGCQLVDIWWKFYIQIFPMIVQLALEGVDCLWVYLTITFFGILFHSSTTLCKKLYFLTFVLQFFLYNFLLWPLVVVWLRGRICSYCTLSILLRIL